MVSATNSTDPVWEELTVFTSPIDRAAVADIGATIRWRDDPTSA